MLVIPAIAALTAANYSGKERAMAYGLLGGIAGAGVAAGPLIGGFVTTVWTWRVVFAAETVVVVAILIFGIRRIQPGPSVEREKLDLVGAALSAIGLGLVVFGILKSSEWGLFQPTGALEIGGEEITPFGHLSGSLHRRGGRLLPRLFRSWEQRWKRGEASRCFARECCRSRSFAAASRCSSPPISSWRERSSSCPSTSSS